MYILTKIIKTIKWLLNRSRDNDDDWESTLW